MKTLNIFLIISVLFLIGGGGDEPERRKVEQNKVFNVPNMAARPEIATPPNQAIEPESPEPTPVVVNIEKEDENKAILIAVISAFGVIFASIFSTILMILHKKKS
tara:strand:- start:229 stop:543 length:315 start_codon:yes stop_codon:yes gene_type:complete